MQIWNPVVEEARAFVESVHGHVVDFDEFLEALAAAKDPDAAVLCHQLGPNPGEFELLNLGEPIHPDYVRFVQSGRKDYRTTDEPLSFTPGKLNRRYK